MSSKQKIGVIVLLVVAIFVFSLVNINITYAKYISDNTSDVEGDVAKFSFVVKDGDSKISSNFVYDLADHVTDGSNLSKAGLVPGKSGVIDITIDMTGSEVATEYEVTFPSNEGIPDKLKFYTDSAMTSEFSLSSSLSDIINLTDINTPVHVKLYYKWLWDESIVENSYENTNLSLKVNVTAWQYVGV